jgi:hypothetical protein
MARPCRTAAVVCLLAFTACRTPAPSAAIVCEREVALPPWIAAAVVGAALHHQLPFADPRPAERGVPVRRLGDDSARFAFSGAGSAALPLASHRLHLLPAGAATAPPRAVLTELPPALVARGRGDITIDVGPGPLGARVHGFAPPCLWRAIDEALATATDPAATLACPSDPDLALVQRHRLARAAATARATDDLDRAREPDRRREPQHRAPGADPADFGDIPDGGDTAAAHDRIWAALLASCDPRTRADAARELESLRDLDHDADRCRRAARERLATDPRAAASLLHRARRLAPEPTADYRLASRLHAHAADLARALPDALLAREHAAADTGLGSHLAELWYTPSVLPATATPPR